MMTDRDDNDGDMSDTTHTASHVIDELMMMSRTGRTEYQLPLNEVDRTSILGN